MAETDKKTDKPQNLPVPAPRLSEIAQRGTDSWITRALRALFGWKSDTIRADLQTVLNETGPSEFGFRSKSAPCCATSLVCANDASPT